MIMELVLCRNWLETIFLTRSLLELSTTKRLVSSIDEDSGDNCDDVWVSMEGPECVYIGRTFSDKTVDENDEHKCGKVVGENEAYDYHYF